MEELGYEDYFYGEGVAAVEWGDKVRSFCPKNTWRSAWKSWGRG